MSLISMACPKCRKQATEYDEHKWQCLHCGIKFLYERPTAPVTNITTSVSLDASALYDIEAGGPPNIRPLMKSLVIAPEKDEVYTSLARKAKRIEDGLPGVNALMALSFLLFVSVSMCTLSVAYRCLLLVILFFVGGVLIYKAKYSLKRTLIARKEWLATHPQLPRLVGTIVLCPYCHEEYKSFLHGEASTRELTHCKDCGRQFLIDGLNSFRIKVKRILGSDRD